MAGGIAEGTEALERQLEDPLAQEDDLLGLAEHAEVRVEAQVESAFAEDAVAEGVEGRDPGLGVTIRDELVHPLGHLDRGLLGEGEGEDLLGPRALARDEVGNAAGEHGGLARARARDDEQRALAVEDRLALGRREPLEDAVFGGRCEEGLDHHPIVGSASAPRGPVRSGMRRARRHDERRG